MKKTAANNRRTLWNLVFNPDPWKVESGAAAIFLVLLVVAMSGAEAAYVQVRTTNRVLSPELLTDISFLLLFSLDILVPLTVALLSRPAFIIYLIAQCFLSTILLHYTIFFYNTLTLSTIYHSMQGAASLGIDIFGFARWEIILTLGVLLVIKLFLVRVSLVRRVHMPKLWQMRGIAAVICMTVISWVVVTIYGKTGLGLTWVDATGHRPAAERRLEEGARESVRSIGYLATWLGEFFSGNYKDTALIYAEARCQDPDGGACPGRDGESGDWQGLPLPPLGPTVIIIQAESLDFAVLDMKVNGRTVTPFLNHLARDSVTLKVFAPHKVGSCNSDYEILNGRVAEQNVIYYTYIKDYPDSLIHQLAGRGYAPTVFHGLSGGLFNLREAYAAQGFTGFQFKEEMLAEGYRPGPYIMEHIVDEDVFDNAAEHLPADGPAAQFIVTMSSHVPFLPAWPEYKSAGGTFARYASSMSYLDRCLGEFYQQLPEGALLIIWGDHGSDVEYPRGFAPGDRHVPLLVHVKGREAWLSGLKNRGAGEWPAREPGLAAGDRIFTLCELHFYLRRIFE